MSSPCELGFACKSVVSMILSSKHALWVDPNLCLFKQRRVSLWKAYSLRKISMTVQLQKNWKPVTWCAKFCRHEQRISGSTGRLPVILFKTCMSGISSAQMKASYLLATLLGRRFHLKHATSIVCFQSATPLETYVCCYWIKAAVDVIL